MVIKAADLKPNDVCWIAGMLMIFTHWDEGSPVFKQFSARNLDYINRGITKETLIEKA